MDVEVARWLVSGAAAPYLDAAGDLPDPSSLSAGAALRRELSPDRAAAVLDLAALRRRSQTKLDGLGERLYLTHDGLEQATRWEVARWRADRLRALGVDRVVDLGCGLGIDAMAFHQVGLSVTGIEHDPVTAILAEANLRLLDVPGGPGAGVIAAAVENCDLTDWLADPGTACFLDPARRTARGRSWRVEDLQPSWEFVGSIVQRASGPVTVKLAPGFPRHRLPPDPDITWVSHTHELVETTLWHGTTSTGRRQAVILQPGGSAARLAASAKPATGPAGRYLYEPDPAVIRAQATGSLADRLGAWALADAVAYLTSDDLVFSPFASCFEKLDTLDCTEKALRTWTHQHEIGTLEIKTRGLGIDPASLRPRLHLAGPNAGCVILSPTSDGAKALIVRRLVSPDRTPPGSGEIPTALRSEIPDPGIQPS